MDPSLGHVISLEEEPAVETGHDATTMSDIQSEKLEQEMDY